MIADRRSFSLHPKPRALTLGCMAKHEDIMGQWVRGRCLLRNAHGHPMPEYVKTWLEKIGGNPHVDPNAGAPPDVGGWLIKTLEDPDWGEA